MINISIFSSFIYDKSITLNAKNISLFRIHSFYNILMVTEQRIESVLSKCAVNFQWIHLSCIYSLKLYKVSKKQPFSFRHQMT